MRRGIILFTICLLLAYAKRSSSVEVAVIDISPLMRDGMEYTGAYKDCTQKIIDALSDKGLFLATSSGWTDEDFTDRAFGASRQLFSLSESEKMSQKLNGGISMRGYIPFGEESGLKDAVFEPKEGYAYGFDATPSDEASANIHKGIEYLRAPNRWPEELPALARTHLLDVYRNSIDVARRIVKAALGTYADNIDPSRYEGGEEISVLRLFHYLPTGQRQEEQHAAQAKKEILGSSAHTDWGLLTVILQDQVGGLEFMYRGEWHAVPPVRGALVINGGDYLHLLQPNLVSPIHRVVSPTTKPRRSFVLFYYPSFNTPMPQPEHDMSGKHVIAAEVQADGDPAFTAPEGLAFNTLLRGLQQEGDGSVPSFGTHIIRKWAGVRRY